MEEGWRGGMIHLAGKMIHHIFSMGLDKTAFTTKEWFRRFAVRAHIFIQPRRAISAKT